MEWLEMDTGSVGLGSCVLSCIFEVLVYFLRERDSKTVVLWKCQLRKIILVQTIRFHLGLPQRPRLPITAPVHRHAIRRLPRRQVLQHFRPGPCCVLHFQGRSLRLGVVGCVDGAVDGFFNARPHGCESVTALQNEGVVGLCVALGGVMRGRGKGVGERVAETGVADEHVLCVVWQIVVGDVEDGDLFADEAGHVVRGLERNFADAERNDLEIVAVDYAALTGVALENPLVDEAFGIGTLGWLVGLGRDDGAVADVVLVQIR